MGRDTQQCFVVIFLKLKINGKIDRVCLSHTIQIAFCDETLESFLLCKNSEIYFFFFFKYDIRDLSRGKYDEAL